jgi:hypothetical protein
LNNALALRHLYSYLDLSVLSGLEASQWLTALHAPIWPGPGLGPDKDLGWFSASYADQLLEDLSAAVEVVRLSIERDREERRVESQSEETPKHSETPQPFTVLQTVVVPVHTPSVGTGSTGGKKAQPELMQTMLSELARVPHSGRIPAPPSALLLRLDRPLSNTSNSSDAPHVTYPQTLYIDAFLESNRAAVDGLLKDVRGVEEEVKELRERKERILNFKGGDTLKNLRIAINHFTNVVPGCTLPPPPDLTTEEKLERAKRTAAQLEGVLKATENEVKTIDECVKELERKKGGFVDLPEMRQHRVSDI